MSAVQKMVMRRFYREADGEPQRLPWHADTPPRFLDEAIDDLADKGRALDIGCGSGVFSSFMARRGLDVTALDYLEDAASMARRAAAQLGAEFDVVCGDFLTADMPHTYDLVFDSGCFHNMSGGELTAYRRKLLACLKPGGHFVLSHWGRRNLLDWRPIGPRRRTQAKVQRLLGPSLELINSCWTDEAVPLPFGPWVRMATYRFRARSEPRP